MHLARPLPEIVLAAAMLTALGGCKRPAATVDTAHRRDGRTRPTAARPDRSPPSSPPVRPRDPHTLLGGERGLDHVGVVVRDLATARRTYHDLLGFGHPHEGKLPNGIQNVNFYFKDTTYLETLSTWDPKRARDIARFAAKGEGAMFLVLAVFSVSETAAFLHRRGLETLPPFPGSIAEPGAKGPSRPMWHTLFFKSSPFPRGSLFFIAYEPEIRRRLHERLQQRHIRRRFFSHPNTALGLRAVWMATRDAAAMGQRFRDIGLAPGRPVAFGAPLAVRGLEVPAGEGSLLLLQPTGPGGAAAALLARRGEGLLGLSVRVRHLQMARMFLEKSTRRTFLPYPGVFGQSILVPPELTHGVWLEFVQD